MIIKDLFEYNVVKSPDNCRFSISPSCIGKFFELPKVWYEEQVLGKEPEFKGSTATTIGTICHYIYECVVNGIPVSKDDINESLKNYLDTKPNDDIDGFEVQKVYPKVAEEVVNKYVLPSLQHDFVRKCEIPLVAEVKDNVYVKGTCDRLEGSVVCDYKTVSTKPNLEQLPFNYKIQLLAYAYMLRKQGYYVDRIRIIYGVKPTKTLPARCFEVTESIDFEAERLINNTLQLIADSVITVQDKPELAYLIFKSMDLKEHN